MAVTVNAFNVLTTDIANGIHDLDTNTIKAALSNTAPSATDTGLADITQIATGGGYVSGGYTLANTAGSASGTEFKLDADDLVIAASGAAIATFRYIVLYNDTVASDKLILYYDLGSAIDLSDGSSYTLEFDPTSGILTIDVV